MVNMSTAKRYVKLLIHVSKSPFARLMIFLMQKVKNPLNETLLTFLRFAMDIQLNPSELSSILKELENRGSCNCLVFGLGYDSIVWATFNKEGKTVFLEDNERWVRSISTRYPQLQVRKIRYFTRRTEFRDYLTSLHTLMLQLPDDVANCKWDVIVVDGPAGAFDHEPGRMQSIFSANRLVAPGGSIFVHDVDRPIENLYSKICFGEESVVSQVGRLRAFRMPASSNRLANPDLPGTS